MKSLSSFLFLIFFIFLLLLVSCTQKTNGNEIKQEQGIDCREHSACPSGVCNHYKADLGTCAIEPCSTGEKTDNNNFFCNLDRRWESSKIENEQCDFDYECYQKTCFMIPQCDLTDIPRTKSWCKENVCVLCVEEDECVSEGMKKILEKNQYDENCIESLAQMELPTVCAPCGDDICDVQLESSCNCPEDCA